MKLVVKICSRSVCPVKTIKDSGCVKITNLCVSTTSREMYKSQFQPNQGMTHGTLQWQQVVIYNDRSVNIVKSSQIHTLIKLRRWIPHNICSTSAGDLLVIVESDDYEQTKVVHYAGSTEIRSIQFNDSGESLYSSGVTKYITDTRNKDICVTDLDLHVVVVVNQAGKFRFTYTGSPSSRVESFYPYGITTDSQCWILIADNFPNNRIHILDEEGRFLQFINCNLIWPRDICVDSKDNLFVADSLNVKRFK